MQAYLIPISQSLLNYKEWTCRQIRPFKETLTVKPCTLLCFTGKAVEDKCVHPEWMLSPNFNFNQDWVIFSHGNSEIYESSL